MRDQTAIMWKPLRALPDSPNIFLTDCSESWQFYPLFQMCYLKGARVCPEHITRVSLSASLQGREQGPRETSHRAGMSLWKGERGQRFWLAVKLCWRLLGHGGRKRYQAALSGKGQEEAQNRFCPTSQSCWGLWFHTTPMRKLTSSSLFCVLNCKCQPYS